MTDFIQQPRSAFVDKYLNHEWMRGVELGWAPRNDFGLTTQARVGTKEEVFPELTHMVEPASWALPFEDKSFDYVFSSHTLEHIYNPIKALAEHCRVAKHFVLHIIPHRERTFDADRPLTLWGELLLRGDLPPPGAPEPPGGHHSVWDTKSFLLQMFQLGLTVLDYEDPDSKIGNGFAVLIDARGPR